VIEKDRASSGRPCIPVFRDIPQQDPGAAPDPATIHAVPGTSDTRWNAVRHADEVDHPCAVALGFVALARLRENLRRQKAPLPSAPRKPAGRRAFDSS